MPLNPGIDIRVKLEDIHYSEKYTDGLYEYRHIHCPKDLGKSLKEVGLMSEKQWRAFGIQQSVGWEHFMIHEPEPHILLFRRKLSDVKL
ncbi:unnamed protein product [Darwinula stevensoni]|uniref:Cyclin-dependent kinases regulatory subunit n=1 Tax=Darwinula stevensoni TaxID=69355 RepID=A0A7R8X0D0_9CRUS|nr:unnamed protein product [Darwinula stevensoni]CAG0881092.1 unnamed protein product [Darwinula stevensoni]